MTNIKELKMDIISIAILIIIEKNNNLLGIATLDRMTVDLLRNKNNIDFSIGILPQLENLIEIGLIEDKRPYVISKKGDEYLKELKRIIG